MENVVLWFLSRYTQFPPTSNETFNGLSDFSLSGGFSDVKDKNSEFLYVAWVFLFCSADGVIPVVVPGNYDE